MRLRARSAARSSAEFARQLVEQALHDERGLRIAGAAHRRDRCLVGDGDRDLHRECRHHVGAAQRRRRVVRQVHVLQRIGAEVVQQAPAQAENAAIVRRGDLHLPILVALLDRGEEMLAAVLDPGHRALQKLRGSGDRDVLRIDAELRAEAAADIRRRDAKTIVVEAEQARQRVEKVVRLLGRGPHGERAVALAVFGKDTATFDGMRRAAMDEELFPHHMGRRAERGVDLAVSDPVGRDDVRGKFAPHLRRIGARSLPAVRGGGQDVVGHVDVAPRRPPRGSGPWRARSRPARPHRRPRRRRAQRPSSGRAACRNSKSASSAAWPWPARGRRVSTRRRPRAAPAPPLGPPRRSAHAGADCARRPRGARPVSRCPRHNGRPR